MRKIYVGADHGGVDLRDKVMEKLRDEGYLVTDLSGKYDPEDDYPDIGFKVGEKIVKENVLGILICRSGAGVCIAANKVDGVRAAMAISPKQARKGVEDDNVNILCLSADHVSEEENMEIINGFLGATFASEERFIRRINKIKAYEKAKLS
jgi:ribose 5-phosphate isomerase B